MRKELKVESLAWKQAVVKAVATHPANRTEYQRKILAQAKALWDFEKTKPVTMQ